MDQSVTGHQFFPVNRVGIPHEVRHSSAGFAKDDGSRRHVPRVQRHFPKSIEPTGRNVAEIQRCRSSAAQSLYVYCESHKVIQVIVWGIANVVRKSGYKERLIEEVRFGHSNGSPIEVSPATDLRGEEFVPGRIIDHSKNPTSITFHSNGYAVCGKPMSKVGRAVERIDHPFVSRWRLLGEPSLLGKDRVSWEGIMDDIDDPLLRPVIGVGDEVDDLFVFNAKAGARTFRQNGSSLPCCVSSDGGEPIEWDILIVW